MSRNESPVSLSPAARGRGSVARSQRFGGDRMSRTESPDTRHRAAARTEAVPPPLPGPTPIGAGSLSPAARGRSGDAPRDRNTWAVTA